MNTKFETQKVTYVKRVDTEEDTVTLIEDHKNLNEGTVTYKVDHKVKKSKGEIVDEYWLVTISHDYTK